jgi:hypothetical protein
VCSHLGVEDAGEKSLVSAAIDKAFADGAGAEVSLHARSVGDLGKVNLVMDEKSAQRIGKTVS